MQRTFRAIAVALTLTVGAFGLAACGSDDDEGGGGSAQTTESQGKKIRVGLVTDIGGLNDRGFNALANAGLQQAIKELGVDGRVLISKTNADYVPNLSTLAQQKYDLIISNGFLMADATNTVATKFPQANFAIIDVNNAGMKDKPKNTQGLVFKEQEAGYLAGYAAGLYTKDEGGSVSTVGGQKIPPVDHYIAGFRAGAEAANPGVETANGYSQDFVDQAKCKEIALDQIAKGSKVVFQVAGQCGLGAIDAAGEKSVQAIGVDADQGYLGAQVMTSALKKVDTAVFDAIKAVQDGSFKGGTDTVATVKSGGVGIGKFSETASKYEQQVKDVQSKISAGEIADIPDTVGGSSS